MDVELVRIGEGGAGGEDDGSGGSRFVGAGVPSIGLTSAAARSRESEEGPATGAEFTRGGEGNNLEVGGRVTVKASSTSISGGPGGLSVAVVVTGALRSDVNFLVSLFLDG